MAISRRRIIVVIVVLSLFELWATLYGASQGFFDEANPTMSVLLANPLIAAAVFLGSIGIVIVALLYGYPRQPQLTHIAAWFIAGIRAGAVLSHLAWLTVIAADYIRYKVL